MEKKEIFFSALLHDIGKFYERSKQFQLKKETISAGYTHAEHSAFVLKTLREQIDFFKQLPESIVEIAKTHHNPKTIEAKIVQLADWLASGERMEDKSVTDYYLNIPLISIFNQIYVKELQDETANQLEYDLTTLSFESIFPKSDAKIGREAYEELVNGFNSQLKRINSVEELLSVLEKYLSLVPVQTSRNVADISLFDHLRVTAAIAVCLYHQFQNGACDEKRIDNIRTNLTKNPMEDQGFILLHADLSGIQKFVFNVASKGAAKSLKGRSTYLVLLMESIAHFIVTQLDLESTNVLYNGGGNFYILVPAVFEEKIRTLRRTINSLLFHLHGGELVCNIGYTRFSAYKFREFQTLWAEVAAETAKMKLHKISEIWEEKYDLLFESSGKTQTSSCRICHSVQNLETDGEDMEICGFCRSFENLTKKMRNCHYVGVQNIEPVDWTEAVSDWRSALHFFGREYHFYENWPGKSTAPVYALNSFEDKHTLLFRFGALNLAVEPDFDKLQEGKRLTCLKLDVDNLGKIFKRGLQPASISRVAVLSRLLRLFFEGYLPYLIDVNDLYKEGIYTVFSGGDDTFLIGKPQTIVEFAQEMREKFAEFTAQNPALSFSAAIGIFGYKHPVIHAAEISEEFLETAKKFQTLAEREIGSQPAKNRLFLLNEVFNWAELNYILEIRDRLVSIIQKTDYRSVLRKVINSTRGFKPLLQQSQQGKLNMQRIWRLRYYLRDIKGENIKKEKNQLIDIYENMWLHDFYRKDEQPIINHQLITAAAKLADLKTRENYDEQKSKQAFATK